MLSVTNEQIISAIKNHPVVFDLTKLPKKFLNYEVYKELIKSDPSYIMYVDKEMMTDELRYMAVRKFGCCIKYIEDCSEELILMALKSDGRIIQYVKNRNYMMCRLAINDNPLFAKYEHKEDWYQDPKFIEIALGIRHGLCYIPKEYTTTAICLQAVEKNSSAIEYISRDQCDYVRICAVALKGNPLSVVYMDQKILS